MSCTRLRRNDSKEHCASERVFALVDCNSFYASCEKVFRPDLRDRPVVALSNNDGCIIARSPEAKALKIEMGMPFFKALPLLRRHNVAYFSSNYALYGDMSRRVMLALGRFTPNLEVYSIDEAFLDLRGVAPGNRIADLRDYGREIRRYVHRATGIPVSVGVAETKVLAKIANRVAKKKPEAEGVFCLPNTVERDCILDWIDVEDIWGVGRRLGVRLRKQGIHTARQLRDRDPDWVRSGPLKMGIVGARLVEELRGKHCQELELIRPDKKEVACTRSFGKPVATLSEMKQSVATYVGRAAEKIRSQRSAASVLSVFMLTNPFVPGPQHYDSRAFKLPIPTSTTPELIECALALAEAMFKPGFRYKKSGVVLTGLVPDNPVQTTFWDERDRAADARLMWAMDRINQTMGKGTLRYACEGVKPGWRLRADHRTPKYTTRWDELRVVKL